MTVASYALSIGASVLVLGVAVDQLRRHRMRERHAVWWFAAGFLALAGSIFPQSLEWVADLIGIQLPVNLVFFASIAILFLVSLQHSAELTALESKTRALAEHIALLEMHIGNAENSEHDDDPKPQP